MFVRSPPSRQTDPFDDFAARMKIPGQRKLNDPKVWHNLFLGRIAAQMDENPHGRFCLPDVPTPKPTPGPAGPKPPWRSSRKPPGRSTQ